MKLSTYFGVVIASGIFLTRVQSIQKTHACEMLIAIDGSLYEKFDRNMDTVNKYVKGLVKQANRFFDINVFTKDYDGIYFQVKEIRIMSGFCQNCTHGKVKSERCTSMAMDISAAFLSEFSKMDTSGFCLAHILTDKRFADDFDIEGMAYRSSVCSNSLNVGFISLNRNEQWLYGFQDSDHSVISFSHEIAHAFGATHWFWDQATKNKIFGSTECDEKSKSTVTNSWVENVANSSSKCKWEFYASNRRFSSCNAETMQSSVKEKFKEACFKENLQNESEPIKYSQWNGTSNEIVCGDGKVEGYEECDCGLSAKTCNLINCYPANLISPDLKKAFPCRFIKAKAGCATSSDLNSLTITFVVYLLLLTTSSVTKF